MFLNLKTDDWKKITLNDYFHIVPGKYHYSDEYDTGSVHYISSSNTNNGIGEYISLSPDFEGNCIITGKIGCTAFYQDKSFCATSDVNIFVPLFKRFNRYVGLFIVTVINFSENYKWSYGRQCRSGNSKKIIINLPVTSDSKPDWGFMEKYIKSLHYKKIRSKNNAFSTKLNTNLWKPFRLGDLSYPIYGVNYELQNFEISNNSDAVNFVARTSDNNGVSARVNKQDLCENPQETISIAGGGSVLSTFYQDKPYYSGRDLFYLKFDSSISKYAKLFLCTVISANAYKYNYGRQANKTMPDIKLKLPVTPQGNPDWIYMENYIKSLPYGDKI